MIKPDPVLMINESGRNFAFELKKQILIIKQDKVEEANQLKETNQEIPEDFYEEKWVRFYMDQKFKPSPAQNNSVKDDVNEGVSIDGSKAAGSVYKS